MCGYGEMCGYADVRMCGNADVRMMGMCESAVECMMGLIVQNDMGFSRS
jgi:hypothetical protein